MADQDMIIAPGSSPTVQRGTILPAQFGTLQRFVEQPAVRRALPSLGMIGVVSLAGAAWWSFQTPTQRSLFEGLADADKSAVADALQSASIAYTLDRATGSIQVNETDLHKARMLLAGQGLPKAAPGGDAMLSSLPLGSSRAVEGETLRSARQADLGRTIEAIDAVKTARVHLATPEPSVFVRDSVAPAASVMLTLQNGRTLSDAQVRAIKHLVAASVPSLSPDQVSVIDQSGHLLSLPDMTGDNAAFQLQLQMEERFRTALVDLLVPILGRENFSAELHVDVDQSESQSTRESYPKDDRALRREDGNKTSTANSLPPAMGIPGTLSNQPPPPAQLAAQPGAPQLQPAAERNDTAETYTRSFDVGREISVTHQPVGKIRRLTVAVALRDVKGAKKRSAAEMASLEALVKGAVGFDQARGDVVAISARPFADNAAADAENFWDAPWFMVALRQGSALIAALLIFIFIGRPLLKSLRQRIEAPARSTESNLSENVQGEGRRVTIDMIETAPSYAERATLVRSYVRDDPARATMVVRQLMQEGSDGNR